jgi:hypothetical protein
MPRPNLIKVKSRVHPTIIISLQHFLRMPFERLPGSIHIGKLPGYVLPRPNSPNTKQVPSSKLDRKNCEKTDTIRAQGVDTCSQRAKIISHHHRRFVLWPRLSFSAKKKRGNNKDLL